jgi:hypothetical protein
MSTFREDVERLRDLAKALDIGLQVQVDLVRDLIVVHGGRQAFEFHTFAAAYQALELANYVAFNREVKKGATPPSTHLTPTFTAEKPPSVCNGTDGCHSATGAPSEAGGV